MKLLSKTDIYVGCVQEEKRVEFEITLEEANSLRNALKIVDSYKAAAFKALNKRNGDADWCEVEYEIKNDRVFINVKKGSIG